jgi:hypothetical protein
VLPDRVIPATSSPKRHAAALPALPALVYRTLWQVDFARSAVIGLLFGVRGPDARRHRAPYGDPDHPTRGRSTMAIQAFIRSTRDAGALDRPRTTHRQDLVTVLLATWLIGGIGLDGWAHSQLEGRLESFFTPWHAVFYSGFVATALWVLWLVQTRRADHVTWTQAAPLGYGLGVVGVAVVAVGGVGDLLWHQVFGIETGIAALLSPTHLLLFTGVALVLLAPFRAAWSSPEAPSAGLLGVLPAFLSITLLTALVAFLFQYSSLFAIDLAFSASEPVRFPQAQPPQLVGVVDAWAQDIQIKGIMAALVTSVILVAPLLLLLLRRWRLPFGAATILFLVVATIVVAQDGFRAWEQLVGAAAAGVAVDAAIARLRPAPDRVGAFRAVGSLIPMAVIGCTFLAAVWRLRLGWPAELWTGTVFFGGLAGYVLAFLMQPTPVSRQSNDRNLWTAA